ncbi:response regulator [Lutibaculum baratangense]|uniref:Response regulator receiver protein n=1 Tax=Lutibaculum baratangense AMV1 TaxID=631454 RepID=V4RPF1_9HYPH|nr:response regulator [Lutibaculum baratangense]ESR25070.1 response regulator receiver protein [Lutibaculum baratangense AMV1]
MSMNTFSADRADFSQLDVVVVQESRHGQMFVRSLLAALKVGRIRGYDTADGALREMRLDPPTLVITDWEMRARSGYWLLRHMRRADMEPLCFVPALVLTPEISWSMLDVALETGVNSVLLKPISATVLRTRLHMLSSKSHRFVQRDGAYVPEASQHVLEERMRAHESADTRAYRQKLRAFLESAVRDDDLVLDQLARRGQPEVLDDGVAWKGWHVA